MNNAEEQYVLTFTDPRDGIRKREVTTGDMYSRKHRAIELRRIVKKVAVEKLDDVKDLPTLTFKEAS